MLNPPAAAAEQARTVPDPLTADYLHTMRLWFVRGPDADQFLHLGGRGAAYAYVGIDALDQQVVIVARSIYEGAIAAVPAAESMISASDYWWIEAERIAAKRGCGPFELHLAADGVKAVKIEPGTLAEHLAHLKPKLTPAAEHLQPVHCAGCDAAEGAVMRHLNLPDDTPAAIPLCEQCWADAQPRIHAAGYVILPISGRKPA